ncbi:MAG: FRG domain-containing protein [Bacteroidota bacterium]|nr:FRG domain-containing protein [Bacteroidota bacterium]
MEKKEHHLYLETTLENWTDIFRLNQRFLSKFIYRGQANEKWKLSTSLERQIERLFPNLYDKYTIPEHERLMLKEFQWKYPLYSSQYPESKDFVEWLTIMQHYGATTRLLDFSYSIFIAMHMAVAENGESGAIWAINKIPLDFAIFKQYIEKFNVNSASHDKLVQFTLEQANSLIERGFEKDIEKQLLIISPKTCNERLSRQQGLFIMPSDIKCSFDDCLVSYLDSTEPLKIKFENLIEYSVGAKYRQEDISLIKIIIPKENNFEIVKSLRAMNITTEILFPGLDGLAKSLNYARFSFQGID